MNALIKIALMLFALNCFSQEIIIEKEVVYLKFIKNDGSYKRYRGVKFYNKKEKGTVFNLIKKGSLLFKDESRPDTLCLKHLNDYKISTIDEVEELERKWRKKIRKN